MKKILWLLVTLLVATTLVLTSCDKTDENENAGNENNSQTGGNNQNGNNNGENNENNSGEDEKDAEKDKETLVDILSGNKLGDIFGSVSGETPEWVGALESYAAEFQIDIGGEILGDKKAARIISKNNVLYILEKDYTTGELNVSQILYMGGNGIAQLVENSDGSYTLSGLDITLPDGEGGEIELPNLDSIVFPETGLDVSKFTEIDGWYALDEDFIKDLIRDSYEIIGGLGGGGTEPTAANITMPDPEDLLDALLTSLDIDVRFAVSGENIQGIKYDIKVNDSFFSYLRLVGIGKTYYIKNVGMAGEVMLDETCTRLSSFSISEKVDYKDITDQVFNLNASTIYDAEGAIKGVDFNTEFVIPAETKGMMEDLMETIKELLGDIPLENAVSAVEAGGESESFDLSFSASAKIDFSMLLATGHDIIDMKMNLVRLGEDGEAEETLLTASILYKNVISTIGQLLVDVSTGDGEDKMTIADIAGVVYYALVKDMPDLGELGNKLTASIPNVQKTVMDITDAYEFDESVYEELTVMYYDSTLGLTLLFDISGGELSPVTASNITVYLGEVADGTLEYDLSVSLGEDGYIFEMAEEPAA